MAARSGLEEWSPVVWCLVPGEVGQLDVCEVHEGRGWDVDVGLAGCHVEGGPLAFCSLPLRTGSFWEGQSLPNQQDFKDAKTSKIQKMKCTTNTHTHMAAGRRPQFLTQGPPQGYMSVHGVAADFPE